MKNFSLILLTTFLLFSCGDYAGDEMSISGGLYYESDDVPSSGDQYAEIIENPFVEVSEEPISTFSIDADGAAYANMRRYIQEDNIIPPKNAIRTEEFINYFDLDYEYNSSEHPISLNGEVATCPWETSHKLIRIGIQGKPLEEQLPLSNFVFLIDVSGSMSSEDKLELLKGGFKSFVDQMRPNDRIAIVTYAGSDKVVLQSTPGTEKSKIHLAINELGSGGSTAGAKGIITAYEIAEQNFIEGGNNRIIMGTDGDFNVGPSSTEELIELIEEKRASGVFLTAIGVGRGNLNDASLEQIANHGNGTFEYVDNIKQLQKVFIYEQSKFFTVAKDVKVQVEFNPALVQSYRLIGYENRVLENEDFENDSTDAGEIGADQNITALYEIIPQNSSPEARQAPTFKIDFRYKMPDGDTSIPMSLDILDLDRSFAESSAQMQFTSAVASFALQLRDSEYKGSSNLEDVISWVESANLNDAYGFKEEFRKLVIKAQGIQ